MSNEFLKQLYERYPEKWKWQFQQTVNGKGLWVDATAGCPPNKPQRLRPILPESLPEPPAEAFAYGPEQPGGVYVGEGAPSFDQYKALGQFSGWCFHPSRTKWERANKVWLNLTGWHYILDLSDPNAEAILEANGLKDTGATQVELVDCVKNEQGLRVMAQINTNEQRIRDALIALGWTPPDAKRDEDWATIADCDIEARSDVILSREQALALAIMDPGAVWIRPKRGDA